MARSRENFDGSWRFHRGDEPGAEGPEFVDSAWRTVDLPHDWSIEGPYDENAPSGGSGGYLPTGIGWYRKTFRLPQSSAEDHVEILFDGVYQHSTVWLNGRELGSRPYGYVSFHYDLTPYLKFDGTPNVLAVRVDDSRQPSSRWYAGSGIFRHVWLIKTDQLRVPVWGSYVTTTTAEAGRATLRSRTMVRNDRAGVQEVALLCELLDAAGATVASVRDTHRVAPGETFAFDRPARVSRHGRGVR